MKWEVGNRKWEVGSGKWEIGSLSMTLSAYHPITPSPYVPITLLFLQFQAIAQVAGIAQARNDIGFSGQFFIQSAYPNRSFGK